VTDSISSTARDEPGSQSQELISDSPSKQLITDLGITDQSLDSNVDDIVERLTTAAACARPASIRPLGLNKMYGINQCLHLASSLVLLESHPEKLKAWLKGIEDMQKKGEGFRPTTDATTYLSIGMLYYLLAEYLPANNANIKASSRTIDEARLEDVRTMMESVNWLVGEDDMKKLGIPVEEAL
jgi:hypothetical protein